MKNKSFFILFLIALVCFPCFPYLAFAGSKVKLYLDDTYSKHILVEKQDCSVHKNKESNLVFGLSFGNMLFSVTPLVSYGERVGIDWNRSVQSFISRYQSLCSRFNSGSMSKQEYDREALKLEDIEDRMAKLEKEAMEAVVKSKQDMFERMDSELAKLNRQETPADAIDKKKEERIISELEKIRKGFDENGKTLTLITTEEAAQADQDPSRLTLEAAVKEGGPSIEMIFPMPGRRYASPFKIIVNFHSENEAEIDPAKLKLEYFKLFTIDITKRVIPYATKNGITVPNACLPSGKHTFRLTVGDSSGGSTSQIFTVDVL
jgi:hypothetical protein